MKLPTGWTRGRLGEKCSIEIGGTPSRNVPDYWDASKETQNLWVSIRDLNQRVITQTAEHISDLGVKHSNVKLQVPGTVLLSFKLTIGRVAVAGCPLYTNEAIAGLRSTEITNEYLYYGLQQWDLLKGVDQAIKGATLNKEKLKRIEFDFPEDLFEQTKISEILSTVDKVIEQTEALIAKQQRIKTGLTHDLLTRGIDQHGNLRSEKTHKFKDSPLGRMPEGWEVKPISSFAPRNRPWLRTGPFGSDLNTKHWVPHGVPVLTIGSLGEGEVIESELLFVNDFVSENLKGFRVTPGDVVFSRVADIGRSLVIRAHQDGWIISSNLMRISVDTTRANPEFLHRNIAFNPAIRAQLRSDSNSGGRELVNGPILSGLLFPWPDISEQNRIVSHVAAIDENIRILNSFLKKSLSFKAGLMQDLLTGKKRVTALLKPETKREMAYASH
jgi:type I restriction enzyme S subunit